MTDPFHQRGCTCNVANKIRAVMAGQEHETCELHDAKAIAARREAEIRQRAEDRLAATGAEHQHLREAFAAGDAARAAADRERGLDQLAAVDPLLARLTRATGAALPLNAPASAYPALDGMHTADPHTPLDAA